MGHRDNQLTHDERAEAALRRALERLGEPQHAAPPDDLVTRTSRRLPNLPPAQAALAAARATAIRRGLRLALGGVLALIVLIGGISILSGEQLALLFGDGAGGLSRAVLTLQLMVKPLWRLVVSAGALQALGVTVALLATSAGCWQLIRSTPIYAVENAP
ncbi:MAG: hypothetical protein IPP13_07255 [Kouleothrix sp.]|jgi:hypothetical protein|nr:hypothetical protein [Kouleothrix sp.]